MKVNYFKPIYEIITLQTESTFKKLIKKGKTYFYAALMIVIIFNSLNFIKGFESNSMILFLKGIAYTFFAAFFNLYFGKVFFKGKSNYWSLFSGLGYLNVLFLYLLPIMAIVNFIPLLAKPLILIFFIYYIILVVKVISMCHKIKPWQSFVIILISSIVIALLDQGIAILLNLPKENLVGQAIGSMI